MTNESQDNTHFSLSDHVTLNQIESVQKWVADHHDNQSSPNTTEILEQGLRQAVRTGRHEIAEFLLERGISPDPNENHPDFDEEKSAVAEARAQDDWRMVELLLEYGANDFALSPMEIHKANTWRFMTDVDEKLPEIDIADYVRIRDTAAVRAWFEKHPETNPNHMPADQMKPLLVLAVSNGDTEIAEILLQHGANPNLTDRQYGFSALHEAVSNNNLAMTNLVLRYGGDVNQPSDELMATPLHLAAADRRPESIAILDRLLNTDNVQVDIKDAFGNGAIHYAAATFFLEKTEKLITQGAAWKGMNNSGDTPFDCARAQNTPAAAFFQTLITQELTQNLGIDMKDWRDRRTDDGPAQQPPTP